MEFLAYLVAPTAIFTVIYFIAKRTTKNPIHILNPKKPFYGSLLFYISTITPLSLWIWYARRYIANTEGVLIDNTFSAFQYIFQENINGGIGFASLSLLLGVMVARFHSSKQNAERINMSLETTQYSNAFSHRKEFNESIHISYKRPMERDEDISVNTSMLHSYFFSDAFYGFFRSENIDREAKELFLLEENLVFSLKDSDISTKSYFTNIRNSCASLLDFISAHNKKMGADMLSFSTKIYPLDHKDGSTLLLNANGTNITFDQMLRITERSLSLKTKLLEASANFLPEIDRSYSNKILAFSLYVQHISGLTEFIRHGAQHKHNSRVISGPEENEKSNQQAIESIETIRSAAAKNGTENFIPIKHLTTSREALKKHIEII